MRIIYLYKKKKVSTSYLKKGWANQLSAVNKGKFYRKFGRHEKIGSKIMATADIGI